MKAQAELAQVTEDVDKANIMYSAADNTVGLNLMKVVLSTAWLADSERDSQATFLTASSGRTTDETRSRCGRSRNSPRCTNGSEDRRSSIPAAMETMLAAHWKTSPRAAITEDDACTLRAQQQR